MMHSPLPIQMMDYFGPAIGALVFVLGMSLLKEPMRKNLNAVLVAGSCGVYISGGGFGLWELLYPLVAIPVVYRGLQSYRFIGVAWLMHAAWDLPHHLWGNPIWPFLSTSSFGCLIFDSLIAIWFWKGAPSILPLRSSSKAYGWRVRQRGDGRDTDGDAEHGEDRPLDRILG